MNLIPHRRYVLTCMLVALALRAAIPEGYMPAKAGSGLLFELCPSGVPAELMAAISGSTHHHDHDPGTDSAHLDAGQCPIGQILSPVVAVDGVRNVVEAPVTDVFSETILLALTSRTPANQRSRDPPA